MQLLRTGAIRAAVLVSCGALVVSQARAGDYLVDPNYTGVDGAAFGNYAAAYKTVTAALGSTGVPAGASASSPNRVYFADGVYNTAASTGTSLSNSRSNLDLIGLSGNPDKVVITSTLDSSYNPGTGALGTTGSSTLQLKGNNVSAYGITFGNSTNTPYIVSTGHKAVSPTGDYSSGTVAQTASAPAVALLLQGDQQAFSNCKFLGFQDTLYIKGGRTFFTNCTVSGDDDFVFANGTAVFKNSTINIDGDHATGAITAASTDKRTANGMVFLNCSITGDSVRGNATLDPQNAANASGPAAGSMYLGRPWGWQQAGGDASTVLVNTKMATAIKSVGWLNWNANELVTTNGKNDGNPGEDSRYAEFDSTDLSGNALDVSARVAWSHQLTASQAAAFTEGNIFSPESLYAWFGNGYAGSADPSSPNFSWAAYWGARNLQNDTSNATISGNPTAYSNPNWALATVAWDANAQLAAVPEPAALATLGVAGVLGLRRRR